MKAIIRFLPQEGEINKPGLDILLPNGVKGISIQNETGEMSIAVDLENQPLAKFQEAIESVGTILKGAKIIKPFVCDKEGKVLGEPSKDSLGFISDGMEVEVQTAWEFEKKNPENFKSILFIKGPCGHYH